MVWLQNALEHVLDPAHFMQLLRELVLRDSVMVETLPENCAIIPQAALRYGHIGSAFGVMPPDRLKRFDKDGLNAVELDAGCPYIQVLGGAAVDLFLCHSGSSYASEQMLGRRGCVDLVQIENLIHAQFTDARVEFSLAARRLGMGEIVAGFLTLNQ